MNVLILALLPAVALGQLPGGITDTTVSSDYEPVQFAVKAINDHLLKTSGGQAHPVGLLDIVHARTQVVAGQKLYLTLHMTGDYICEVNVWYRAWLQGNDRLIITDGPDCAQHGHKSARIAGGMGGGVSDPMPLPQSGTSEHDAVLEALQFAACHMNDQINSMFASVPGDTSSVMFTQQVTSGMTYHFTNVPMMSTHCRNTGCTGLDKSCHANPHGQKLTCSFTVQYQAWMPTKYTLTNVSC